MITQEKPFSLAKTLAEQLTKTYHQVFGFCKNAYVLINNGLVFLFQDLNKKNYWVNLNMVWSWPHQPEMSKYGPCRSGRKTVFASRWPLGRWPWETTRSVTCKTERVAALCWKTCRNVPISQQRKTTIVKTRTLSPTSGGWHCCSEDIVAALRKLGCSYMPNRNYHQELSYVHRTVPFREPSWLKGICFGQRSLPYLSENFRRISMYFILQIWIIDDVCASELQMIIVAKSKTSKILVRNLEPNMNLSTRATHSLAAWHTSRLFNLYRTTCLYKCRTQHNVLWL